MRLRCVSNAFEVRLKRCDPFVLEVWLGCVSAFEVVEVCWTCVWSAFEMRLRCV